MKSCPKRKKEKNFKKNFSLTSNFRKLVSKNDFNVKNFVRSFFSILFSLNNKRKKSSSSSSSKYDDDLHAISYLKIFSTSLLKNPCS